MDAGLVSILLTGLFALALSARLSAHLAGPAGRSEPMPRYQRRALGSLVVALLCLVLLNWLRQRDATSLVPRDGGTLAADVLMLGSLALAFVALRGRPSADAAGLCGIALGTYCFAICAHHTALAFASVGETGGERVRALAASWGVAPSTLGFVALLHYVLAPLLIAAGIAARDEFAGAPVWARDQILRKLALGTSGLALVYVAFTWGAFAA